MYSSPDEALICCCGVLQVGRPGLLPRSSWSGVRGKTCNSDKGDLKCAGLIIARAAGMGSLGKMALFARDLRAGSGAPERWPRVGCGSVEEGGFLSWSMKAVTSRWRPSGMPKWWQQGCPSAAGASMQLRSPTWPWTSSALWATSG